MLQEHGLHLTLFLLLVLVDIFLLARHSVHFSWKRFFTALVFTFFLSFSLFHCSFCNPFLSGHQSASNTYHPCCSPQLPSTETVTFLIPPVPALHSSETVPQPVLAIIDTSPLANRGPPVMG